MILEGPEPSKIRPDSTNDLPIRSFTNLARRVA
jgi:hypothetical protein